MNLTNRVLSFFKEISAIPRQSGNEKSMQNYLVNFAQMRKFDFYQDEFNNVIIYKKTADKEPIILQAHTDMVFVTSGNYFSAKQNNGVKLAKKGRWMYAKDTSLGADDGIGIALILAILDSDIPCNIEAVFTATEETTMRGAYNIDVTKLKAKKMICLDGFENNAIVVSSASFTDFLVKFNQQTLPHNAYNANYHWYRIDIKGLLGGHSGFDIDKNRGNSHQMAITLLQRFSNVKLSQMIGGHQFNVIPTNTTTVFATMDDAKQVDTIVKTFLIEQSTLFPLMQIDVVELKEPQSVLCCSDNIFNFIAEFQYGVLLKDEDGNVLVSQNLSEIDTKKGIIKIGLRSNLKDKENSMLNNLQTLCQKHGLNWEIIDTQPGFETLQNSLLLYDLQRVNSNSKKIKMHIAVECGIFQTRMENLDTVIISPTILCAHSVQEKLDLDSVKNTARWLEKYLKLN